MSLLSPPLKSAIIEFWEACADWEPNLYAQVIFQDRYMDLQSICDFALISTTAADYAAEALRVQRELSVHVYGRTDVLAGGYAIPMAMRLDGDHEPACRLGHVFAKCPEWKNRDEFDQRFTAAWRDLRKLGRVVHLERIDAMSTPRLTASSAEASDRQAVISLI